MKTVTRREFLKAAGMGVALLGTGGVRSFAAEAKRRVIVIGGGWGGATAAKYFRLDDSSIEVTLLEPNKEFISCPFSNLVLGGVESLKNLTMNYDGLRKRGVRIRHEAASAIEPDKKRVRVGKDYLEYDRLVVSPGIDFQWDQVEGLAQAKDTRAPCLESRAADGATRQATAVDEGRRRRGHDGSSCGLSLPAGPLRTRQP